MEGERMGSYEESLRVMEHLFQKDTQFALATVKDEVPSLRFVDVYYEDAAFYIVTYGKSRKVQEITENPNVALCKNLYSFQGKASNIGHPLQEENKEIRKHLVNAFEPWYFEHNNEEDQQMCYVKVELTNGFFYEKGTAYRVDFLKKEVESFPFTFDIKILE